MRDTGPIRVRRGGDDSRVSSYLGLARKILGEVKQRAAAGGLATLYRALTLADGTWIRVGTVHGQDLVEIVPVGGGEEYSTSPGFIAKPFGDPITTRFLFSKKTRNDNEKWVSSIDLRPAPNYQDWHSRNPIAGSGRFSVVHWLGGSPVRYVGGSTRGTKILIDAVEVSNAPGNVHGACARKKNNGEWVLRCVYGSSASPITIAEAGLSFSSESGEFSVGTWSTIDSVDVSSLLSGLGTGTQPRLAFWNASGSSFLFWAKDTDQKYAFVRADVIETESGFSVSTQILGFSPQVTLTLSRSVIDECLAFFDSMDPACDNKLCYHWASTYLAECYCSTSDGIIACDWSGDDVVFMTAMVDGATKYTNEYNEKEFGDPGTWGPFGNTFEAGLSTRSCDLSGGYGSWYVTVDARTIPLPTLTGEIDGVGVVFIENNISMSEVTDSEREENVYARAGAGCYAEAFGGGDGLTCTKPTRFISTKRTIRSLAFLDLRSGVCAAVVSKTNNESSVSSREFSGPDCSSIRFGGSKSSTTSGNKYVQRKGAISQLTAYENTSTTSIADALDNGLPSEWTDMRNGAIGNWSASRYITINDFLGPSTYVLGATNKDGDALISSEISSGSELLAISYLNKEDPKDIAGLGSSAYFADIAAVGA